MRTKSCPVCGHQKSNHVFFLKSIPVFVNTLSDSIEEAKSVVKGTQNLVQCNYCGFVYNCEFKEDKVQYSTDYHTERGHSIYYLQHTNRVVDFIESVKPIKGQRCLEVACGNGEFLHEISKRGPDKVIGVDPSVSEDYDLSIELQCALFDEDYLQKMERPVDLLINRHMIEHILNPLEMLIRFNKALKADGVLYLEMPRLDWILENKTFFDFPYEHCAYYSDDLISRLLRAVGFEISEKENSYDGQYFSICARKVKEQVALAQSSLEDILRVQGLFSALTRTYTEINCAEAIQGFRTETLRSDISDLKSSLHTENGLYFWGAASKGVMCANLLDQWGISGFIDQNPYKQGKFIPGTGHKVLSPAEITHDRVKTIVVENEVYFPEIQADVFKIDPNISVHLLNKLFRM